MKYERFLLKKWSASLGSTSRVVLAVSYSAARHTHLSMLLPGEIATLEPLGKKIKEVP